MSAEEVKNEKARLKGYKGALTRKKASLKTLLDYVDKSPTEKALSELEQERDKVAAAHKKVEDSLMKLQVADHEKAEQYEEQLKDLEDEISGLRTSVLTAVDKCAANAVVPAQRLMEAPVSSGGSHRSCEALKPFVLTKDHNPGRNEIMG